MFLLLGIIFLALGLVLALSVKRKKAEYENKLKNITNYSKKDKKSKNKVEKLQEKASSEIKKSKTNAYSFIAAGICCILVEITLKFL
ncbi:MAG: hypothetical protein RR942_12915 [Romboutsia sp.]